MVPKLYYTQNLYLNYRSSLHPKVLKIGLKNLRLNKIQFKKTTFFHGVIYKKYLYLYSFLLLNSFKTLVLSKNLIKKRKTYRNFFFETWGCKVYFVNLILIFFFNDFVALKNPLLTSSLKCILQLKPEVFFPIKFDAKGISVILH